MSPADGGGAGILRLCDRRLRTGSATLVLTGSRSQRPARGRLPTFAQCVLHWTQGRSSAQPGSSRHCRGPLGPLCLCRHEHMHASQEIEQPSSPRASEAEQPSALDEALQPFLDVEAMQVEAWAQQHASSDSDAETCTQDSLPALFVCSGSWGSMHTPTAESLEQYNQQLRIWASSRSANSRHPVGHTWAPPALP